jgi:hypothetical protein
MMFLRTVFGSLLGDGLSLLDIILPLIHGHNHHFYQCCGKPGKPGKAVVCSDSQTRRSEEFYKFE